MYVIVYLYDLYRTHVDATFFSLDMEFRMQ